MRPCSTRDGRERIKRLVKQIYPSVQIEEELTGSDLPSLLAEMNLGRRTVDRLLKLLPADTSAAKTDPGVLSARMATLGVASKEEYSRARRKIAAFLKQHAAVEQAAHSRGGSEEAFAHYDAQIRSLYTRYLEIRQIAARFFPGVAEEIREENAVREAPEDRRVPSEGFHGLIDEGSQASESLLDYDSTSATIQRDESGYPTGSAAAYHLVGSEGPAPRAEEVAPATKSVGDGRGRGELSQVNDPLRGKGIKTLKALLDTKISEQLRARIIHKLDTLAQAAAEAKPTPKPKPSPKAQLRERLAKGVPLAASWLKTLTGAALRQAETALRSLAAETLNEESTEARRAEALVAMRFARQIEGGGRRTPPPYIQPVGAAGEGLLREEVRAQLLEVRGVLLEQRRTRLQKASSRFGDQQTAPQRGEVTATVVSSVLPARVQMLPEVLSIHHVLHLVLAKGGHPVEFIFATTEAEPRLVELGDGRVALGMPEQAYFDYGPSWVTKARALFKSSAAAEPAAEQVKPGAEAEQVKPAAEPVKPAAEAPAEATAQPEQVKPASVAPAAWFLAELRTGLKDFLTKLGRISRAAQQRVTRELARVSKNFTPAQAMKLDPSLTAAQADDFIQRMVTGLEAARVRLAKSLSGQDAVPRMQMQHVMATRAGVTGRTTPELIIAAQRTAATRTARPDVKVGQLLLIKTAPHEAGIIVRVTRAPRQLKDEPGAAERWSKLEGWAPKLFADRVGHWQFEYEYVDVESASEVAQAKVETAAPAPAPAAQAKPQATPQAPAPTPTPPVSETTARLLTQDSGLWRAPVEAATPEELARLIFTLGDPEFTPEVPGLEAGRVANRRKNLVEVAAKTLAQKLGVAFHQLPMNYTDGVYGHAMQLQFRGKSTMDLIRAGQRTATTRNQKPEVALGDIVLFYDGKGGRVVTRITRAPYRLPKGNNPDHHARLASRWSELEGWAASVYDKYINAWQFQYERLGATTEVASAKAEVKAEPAAQAAAQPAAKDQSRIEWMKGVVAKGVEAVLAAARKMSQMQLEAFQTDVSAYLDPIVGVEQAFSEAPLSAEEKARRAKAGPVLLQLANYVNERVRQSWNILEARGTRVQADTAAVKKGAQTTLLLRAHKALFMPRDLKGLQASGSQEQITALFFKEGVPWGYFHAKDAKLAEALAREEGLTIYRGTPDEVTQWQDDYTRAEARTTPPGVKFSKRTVPVPTITAEEAQVEWEKNFNQAARQWAKKGENPRQAKPADAWFTSPYGVRQMLGALGGTIPNRIRFSESQARKMWGDDGKHVVEGFVPMELIRKRLPKLMADPLLMWREPTDTIGMLLDATNAKGEPIVLFVKGDGDISTIFAYQQHEATRMGFADTQERIADKFREGLKRSEAYARDEAVLAKWVGDARRAQHNPYSSGAIVSLAPVPSTRSSSKSKHRTPELSPAAAKSRVITRDTLVKRAGGTMKFSKVTAQPKEAPKPRTQAEITRMRRENNWSGRNPWPAVPGFDPTNGWHRAVANAAEAGWAENPPSFDTPPLFGKGVFAAGVEDRTPLDFRILEKISGKHGEITPQDILDLSKLMADPLFIYPHKDGLRVVLDRRVNGTPIVVGINNKGVRTMFAPEGGVEAIAYQVREALSSAANNVYARNANTLAEARVFEMDVPPQWALESQLAQTTPPASKLGKSGPSSVAPAASASSTPAGAAFPVGTAVKLKKDATSDGDLTSSVSATAPTGRFTSASGTSSVSLAGAASSAPTADATDAASASEPPIYPDLLKHVKATLYVRNQAKGRGATLMYSRANATGSSTTQELEEEIIANIRRILGETFNVKFVDNISGGYSGAYLEGWRYGDPLIEIARGATNPRGTSYHEAMHHIFKLLSEAGAENVKEVLANAATNAGLRRKLTRLLAGHPEAIEQLRDREEAAAYLFEFWQAGQIELGPKTEGFFEKVLDAINRIQLWLREALWGDPDARWQRLKREQVEMAERLLTVFERGGLADPLNRNEVIDALEQQAEALNSRRAVAKIMHGKFGKFYRRAVASAASTFENSANDIVRALGKELFHLEGAEGEYKVSYLEAKDRANNQWQAKVRNILDPRDRDGQPIYSAEDLKAASNLLSTRVALDDITDPLLKRLVGEAREFMRQMYNYQRKAKLARWDPAEERWVPMGKVQRDYWPRVWDPDALLTKHDAFIAKMSRALQLRNRGTEGETFEETAEQIFRNLTDGSGQEDITEAPEDLGLTPFQASVNVRELAWLDDVMPGEFGEFYSTDIVKTMTSYAAQATRRAEYSRRFGSSGQKLRTMFHGALINEMRAIDPTLRRELAQAWPKTKSYEVGLLLEKAKALLGEERFSEVRLAAVKKLEDVALAVQAVEGTLGRDISPTLRALNSKVTTYQNFRVLPMALFSSLIDPLGIIVRGGTMRDAYSTFVRGVRAVVEGWQGKYSQDELSKFAEQIGVVGSTTLLNGLGETYSSQFMTGQSRVWNEKLFKWNGLEAWNRAMRIGATGVAVRAITHYLKHPTEGHNARYLEELFGDPLDNDLKSFLSKDGELNTRNRVVQAAIYRWVNGAILRPNAAHRPILGSDPHYLLFYHLKQFTYSFHKVILRRAWEEARHGNYFPATSLITAFVPVMIAADVIKELAIPGDEPWWMRDLASMIGHGVHRANILGLPQMYLGDTVGNPLNLYRNPAGVASRLSNVFGPAPDQVADMLTVPLFDNRDLEREALKALPFGSLAVRLAD